MLREAPWSLESCLFISVDTLGFVQDHSNQHQPRQGGYCATLHKGLCPHAYLGRQARPLAIHNPLEQSPLYRC